jgi:hypothetical protein
MLAASSGSYRIVYSYDGITWFASPSGNSMFSLGYNFAWNGSLWVACGEGANKLAYSSDGINWTASTSGTSLFTNGAATNISTNGSLWVAGGYGDCRLAYSYDGITWFASTSGNLIVTDYSGKIAWNGSLWVACGGSTNKLIYSTDGINWTVSTNGNSIFTTNSVGVAWNGSLWVACGVGTNPLAWSTDGKTWNASTNGNSIFTNDAREAAWNGSLWVAGGAGTNCFAWSSDGKTWNGSTSGNSIFNPQNSRVFTVAWNGSVWLAGGGGTGRLAYSSDGINWNQSTSGNSIIDGTVYGVASRRVLPYVGSSSLGRPIYADQYSSAGGTGYMLVNKGAGSTGIQYSNALTIGPSIQTVFGASGTTGPSSNPTIFVNADILPTRDEIYSLGSRDFKFKTINLAAKTIFLGTSSLSTDSAGNVVITSTDGTSAVPSTNENFMIAVGDDTVCPIKYSTNGTTWTNAKTGPLGPSGSAPPFQLGLTAVWTGNIWLAGGVASGLTGGSSILKSNNGREWFVPAITTDPFTQYGGPAAGGVCISIAYNASQNLIVAGGNQGNEDYSNYNHIFYSADDGNTWTPINYTAVDNATGYCRKVATDGKSDWYLIDVTDPYQNGTAYRSTDGINWVAANSTGMFSTNSIQYNGHYWLACGGGPDGFTYYPSITKSYDGITWTPVLTGTPDGVNQFLGSDIAWNGIYWVCVGRGAGSNLFTSQDGETWKQLTDFANIQLNTIAWNGEVWVAGGSFPVTYDVNGNPINSTVSFIVSYDTIDWYSVSGAAFSGTPIFTASRRILPFGGSPPGSGGSIGAAGTVVANETSEVAVTNNRVTANSVIILTLHTVGGTVGPAYVSSKTAGTGFSIKSQTDDTSTYDYLIIN